MTNDFYPKQEINEGIEVLKQVIGSSLRAEQSALIGDPATGGIYVNNNTKTEMYVHNFGSDPSGTHIIATGGVPRSKLRYGQPILIKKTGSGQYRYVGIDVQADEIFSEGSSEDHTQEPVYVNQLRWGTIHPYSGLQVLIVGAWYGDSYIGDLLTDAFDGTAQDTSSSSISVPTTNNRQIAVLVQVDTTNGALEYKQSTEYSALISPTRAYSNNLLPTLDSDRYRVGFIFLKAGASTLGYSDFFQAPEIISKGSGSGGAFPHTITTDITIAAGYQQLFKGGLVFNGGSLQVNGQLVFV